MNRAEIIKGIETTIEGLNTIRLALESEKGADSTPNTKKETEKVEEKKTPKKEVESTEETTDSVKETYSLEELKKMKYNEFKKLASSLGVKCTGTRDEILKRIIDLGVVAEDAETEEKVAEKEEEAPKDNGKVKKFSKKKEEPKEEDEPEEDEFDTMAKEVAESTDIEDIIEALADVDIKATKKNAVAKLAQALRDGLIELDDDEDEDGEDSESEAEAQADDDEDIEADSYFSEYDPDGINDPSEMTEERAEAVVEKMDEILTSYSDGTLTDDDIKAYIEDSEEEELDELLGDGYTETDALKLYMEIIKRTIDNDGEAHEDGEPYEVGDKNLCCGHELRYVKKTKMYVCSHCGTEYEAE